jgi:GrpB-like predicted nucleotidyltransferase (UPF0157 family)
MSFQRSEVMAGPSKWEAEFEYKSYELRISELEAKLRVSEAGAAAMPELFAQWCRDHLGGIGSPNEDDLEDMKRLIREQVAAAGSLLLERKGSP